MMDIQGSNPSYSPNPPPAASHSRSLLRWLESQAEQTPDAVAVEHHDSRLTYRELHARARAIAQWLRVEGVRPGEPVGLCIERGIPGLVTLLGILKAGAGIAPLDPQYPIARLRDMAEVARLRFVVCSEATKSLLRSMEGLRVLQLPDLQDSNREFAAEPPVDSDPHSLLYVIFTSGSTGRPKGVAMPQSPLVNLVEWQARQSSLPGVGTRTLQFTTLSFDVAYQEIFLTWSTGGTLVLISEELRYDPAALWRYILAARVQRLFLPCIALNQLVDAALRSGQVDSDLREIITAGEQLRITSHMRQFFSQCSNLSLHNHYGPSETHVASAYQLSGHPASWEELPPIGRAIDATELHILSKDLTPVADGEDGELFISGECLADGYIHQPELTQARFIELQLSGKPAVRAYRTGDLARRRADGEIMFLGRLDDQIKIRGFRIELGEVETVLCSHPAVREALAVAVGDGAERRLAACLVLLPGMTVQTQSLRDHVRSKLSEPFVPSHTFRVEKLPLTPSGKADRRAAASGFEGRILEASPGETPPGTADPTTQPSMSDRVEAIWRALLHLPAIPHDVRFFDAGGNSLLLVSLQERLERELAVRISVADLFRYSTISQQAAWLGTPSPTRVTEPQAHPAGMPLPDPSTLRNTSIAVVGMAGRFPGCSNVDELWENLCAGKELTTVFDDAQLSANGTSPEVLQDPAFTRRRGVLENPGAFDAEFFSMTSQEARLTDPQHRLFLECAWAALEDAGCDPHRVQGLAGVYAGCSLNTYFLNQVAASRARMASFTLAFQADQYPTLVGNDKDYLATRVAYKLHLRGPAVSIQTACSTSLTAVVQACAALQSGQCDVALAGGASVSFPQERGCLHQEGAIVSADGRCRPFDARASGTVFGAGVGVVVLKRLSDALASGDQIHAVIRGAALNNDGGDKASFSAPSAKGQADVIRRAMELAGLTPDQVGYVEAHGTGTPLGDPIEVQALKEVFGDGNRRRQKCWLGSIKGNTGHLEAAAGITGLLKAVLAVREGRIPGTAHFESPNPKCALDDSCFAVSSTVKEW
ncbi:MAG: amino acid adenylation domain-containing protein, partial [Verrucomicrobia bacterium]|nr:amino acid adenylation domain-containing protein [Verrucomicrobiota bacterium]